MKKEKVKAAIEAILFAMGDSVELSRLSAALEKKPAELTKLLHEMEEDYKRDSSGLQLVFLEDSVQLCTKGDFYE